MDTQYIGEHLGPGQLGHFFVILAFVAAIFSSFSYFRAAQSESLDMSRSQTWLLMGRNGFVFQSAAFAGIFISLYYIIANHLFEYHYAWAHSDLSLSPKYLLSCFWEGQEGSFLLWSIWHCVLGLIVMRTAGVMESRVMAIISFVQVCLATMLLGFYFGQDINIGSTPFILLRDKMQNAPIFSQPNYLEMIQDGNGLNVLLQNYWMVIHPPVLFLGFASTLIPFAYTIAALWKGDYRTWLKPTLVWSLFAGGVLGLGIMMGGAWAYESLTFGGYWAWDPVENASLVPWLTLVAALHTLIVYKATGRSLIITIVLFSLTYLLIWYSTYLTRTGVLGDTSVHSFTGEGQSLFYHLLIVLGLLMIMIIGLMIKRWKSLPRVRTEEQINSREFWMFVGSFVLLLSAIQIIISTSIPVWSPLVKWISGKEVAPPTEPVDHYNSIQVWVAIVVGILSASILYLKFKKSDNKTVIKRLGITAGISLVLALFIGYMQEITTPQYAILLFAAVFAVVANINYAISIQKVKFKKLGASTSHLGFGLILLGVLLSSYNKEVISYNTLGVVFPLSKDTMESIRESRENVLLYKNVTVAMGEYDVTYTGAENPEGDLRTFFNVEFKKIDTATGNVVETFNLKPNAFVNPKGQEGGLSANPASKHYLTKDIFTYVNSYLREDSTDDSEYEVHKVKPGDTIFLTKSYMVFSGFDKSTDNPAYEAQPGDIAVSAQLEVYDLDGPVKKLAPVFVLRNQQNIELIEDSMESMNLYTKVGKVIPEEGAAEILVKQTEKPTGYIVLKALVFPYINVLWLGIIVMVFGFLLSMYNRITKKEKQVMILQDEPLK